MKQKPRRNKKQQEECCVSLLAEMRLKLKEGTQSTLVNTIDLESLTVPT